MAGQGFDELIGKVEASLRTAVLRPEMGGGKENRGSHAERELREVERRHGSVREQDRGARQLDEGDQPGGAGDEQHPLLAHGGAAPTVSAPPWHHAPTSGPGRRIDSEATHGPWLCPAPGPSGPRDALAPPAAEGSMRKSPGAPRP
ncbi:MAG TPA: hypothetical protein VJA16_05310 [Thermoanaerobaculia bacterium]